MRSARVNVCSGSSQPSLSSQQPKRRRNGLDRQLKKTRLSPQDRHYHSCLWWGHYSTAEKYHKNSDFFFYPQKDLFTRLLCKKNAEITGPSHRHKKKRQKTKNGPMIRDVGSSDLLFFLFCLFLFFALLSFYLPWSTYRHHASALVFALSWPVITKVYRKKAKIREESNSLYDFLSASQLGHSSYSVLLRLAKPFQVSLLTVSL